MRGSLISKLGSAFSNFDAKLQASKFVAFVSQLSASTAPTEINTDKFVGNALSELFQIIIKFVYYLIYSICRFALNLVDFCEVLVNKLSGISGQKSTYSPQADFDGNPIFRFLTNDIVLKTFLIMIGIAIVMVIVFSIIAIVKNEYDAYSDDKDNGKGPIFRRALKSCFLFLLAPMMLFVFIFGSNAILNSVNNAFKSGIGNYTLGGQIFVSSTYEANRYRTYAKRGTRAPILFDFVDPAETGFADVATAEELAIAYSSWENGKAIYNAFATQEFDKYSDTIVYKNNKLYNSSAYSGYETFVTTPEEYYVMADFMDYAVANALQYYIKALDDPDIDWEAVRSEIGDQVSTILSNGTFSVPYKNESGIAGDEAYYIKEYVNTSGYATTPLAAALSTIQQVLALGNFSGNTFKELERVDGYSNYVRWKSEMAKDEDDSLLRVYTLTKWTYNTRIEQLQTRDPIYVVLKDGVFYGATRLVVQDEINAANGKYAFKCNTSNLNSKVDRVAVDTILTYDDGTEYRDNKGQLVTLPKDELEVAYKKVTWPEKLYNDLMIIYSDIGIENYISNGTWQNVVSSCGVSGSISGSIDIPTAFISPLGMIMSELFLGNVQKVDDSNLLAQHVYSSIYDKNTIDDIIVAIGGVENYTTLMGQIDVFGKLFNNMMAEILDSAAYTENVAEENMADSVSLNSYKQYLASVLLSQKFAEYFADVANDIILFNKTLSNMRQNGVLAPYGELTPLSQNAIVKVLGKLESDTLTFNALLNYTNGTNPYAHDEVKSGGLHGDKYSYSVSATDNYAIRSKVGANFAGKDLVALVEELESARLDAIDKFSRFGIEDNLNAIYAIDDQLYAIQNYLIVTAFRDYISEITNQSIHINMNGHDYNVVLGLSTTQIAEFAFGNQLKTLAPDFYQNDNSFLYVDPQYQGLVTLNANGSVRSSFDALYDFLTQFGNMSFALNNSNFVKMGQGASDTIYGEEFYNIFARFILDDLFKEFSDMPGAIFAGYTGHIDQKDNAKVKISYSYSQMLKDDKGNVVLEDGKVKYNTIDETQIVSYKQLVRLVLEYWGLDFKETTRGLKYQVQSENYFDEHGVLQIAYYTIIDGVRYDLETIDGKLGINFANGENYFADQSLQTITLGDMYVGKTLVDYRREAMQKIVKLENRTDETDAELSTRFLSMFYFLCGDYQTIENNKKIALDVYSKSLVKQLAGVLNRPDGELIGRGYTLGDSFTKDEANGTVFVICTFDKESEKFLPFLVSAPDGTHSSFHSKYISNEYRGIKFPVVARGIIDENGNPTAIRLNARGDIEFYRDNVYIVNASKMGLSVYFQSVEDVTVHGSVVSTIVNGVAKLFAGKTLTEMVVEKIPRLAADATLNFAYGNSQEVVGTVRNGYFPMSYDFSVLGIDAFYSVGDLNIIILVLGTIMIVYALLAAVWGLIQRIFDIVVLFLVSPPIIATLPLEHDDTSGKFVGWRDRMISSVLSVYGIVVGLNAFFIFLPYINELEFFASDSVIMNNRLMRMFGDINFINYLFRVIFTLAAIGLIRRAPTLLSALVNPGEKQDIFSKGEATQGNVRAAVETVKDHMSGQYIMDKSAKIAGMAKDLVPGLALVQKGSEIYAKRKDKMTALALEMTALSKGVPKDVAEKAAKNLNDKMQAQRAAKAKEKAEKQKALQEREEARQKRDQVGD